MGEARKCHDRGPRAPPRQLTPRSLSFRLAPIQQLLLPSYWPALINGCFGEVITTIRILYVDDEPDIREIATLSLELDPALEVRSCESGAEALQITAQWRPDLILLDVMMPGMDGPTTLGKLREQEATADVPIVFITARAQSAEVDRWKALGAAEVIAKPFNPMTLASQIKGYANQLI